MQQKKERFMKNGSNKPKTTLRQRLDRENVAGYLCTLPFSFGFFVFTLFPIAASLYYSFTDFDILSSPQWVGLKNYADLFLSDETFWTSLGVTLYYTLVSVPLKLLFALFVAMIFLRTSRMSAIYRAVYYLPSIIGSSVAVAVLWKRMFATDGIINAFLSHFGFPEDFAWLGNTKTAIWTLILLTVWQFGSSMLIFLAALKQIPTTLYEAARVDGASSIKQFFKITLPLLTPTIFFNLIMQMITAFMAFTQCYIITNGKPLDSTLFYAVYMYRQSFDFYHFGYGAAMAWIMLIIIATVTFLIFKTSDRWVYKEGE
ncbi:MAG: sugar ABC transporter permease [Gemmiger sp.]|nr:sugar ABC transporter permease [Gemmiger sp.]MDY5782860.1 sugar ABC transporter permease [Gemmiger sp.]